MKTYRYSEIFGDTIQGEGHYSGRPTVWIRWWGCNFNCGGFGQQDPSDPSSWELSYQDINIDNYEHMEDLPVFEFGCDSSYSWSKKFASLSHRGTAKEIADQIQALLTNEHNPNGQFHHQKTGQHTHMAFTGGEPMMSQTAIVDVMEEFRQAWNPPKFVTIETNGTQVPREAFWNFFTNKGLFPGELFWSVSPKLSASGERWDDAIKPEVVHKYRLMSTKGQLKYVVDGSKQCWDEVDKATDLFRKAYIKFPVWIMPVGARVEEQKEIQAHVAEEAIRRGYNVATRIQCFLFDNVIGK